MRDKAHDWPFWITKVPVFYRIMPFTRREFILWEYVTSESVEVTGMWTRLHPAAWQRTLLKELSTPKRHTLLAPYYIRTCRIVHDMSRCSNRRELQHLLMLAQINSVHYQSFQILLLLSASLEAAPICRFPYITFGLCTPIRPYLIITRFL